MAQKQYQVGGQIKVNLGVQFRSLNPVSRALEGSHKCSEESRLEE